VVSAGLLTILAEISRIFFRSLVQALNSSGLKIAAINKHSKIFARLYLIPVKN